MFFKNMQFLVILSEVKGKKAGVAEFGKGAGLRTLSRRSPRVRITPPAWFYLSTRNKNRGVIDTTF